ncbi:MAG: hypothetical protein JWO09_1361 [Bacteroidetes bacterium]|nr:hypothetical protein [Bacteroidota bacterium]
MLFIFCLFALPANSQVKQLRNAHAHNDYKHRHPLCDAMRCGFTSFEADVFLRRGKLIVAHLSPFLNYKTAEQLYFQPLYDSLVKNKGSVYASGTSPVILLIDIKSDADKTYAALKPLLEKYASMLTWAGDGIVHAGAVTVILSGHKPYAALQKESHRLAFIDQPLLNVAEPAKDSSVYALASCKYSSLISWKGKGDIDKAEENNLKALVALTHAQGKKVRLWASPENKEVWAMLLKNGVDLINTDELEELKEFLLNHP